MHKAKWIGANAMTHSVLQAKKAGVGNQKKIPIIWGKHRGEVQVGMWDTMWAVTEASSRKN